MSNKSWMFFDVDTTPVTIRPRVLQLLQQSTEDLMSVKFIEQSPLLGSHEDGRAWLNSIHYRFTKPDRREKWRWLIIDNTNSLFFLGKQSTDRTVLLPPGPNNIINRKHV